MVLMKGCQSTVVVYHRPLVAHEIETKEGAEPTAAPIHKDTSEPNA